MKKLLLLLLSISLLNIYSQELETDLFGALNSSSLSIFLNSDKSKLTVTTYRNSKEKGMLEETSTTYRKGKIKANKINFSIKYTEHYILEDRKRSVGNFQFDSLNHVYRYERSDYNNRNVRMATFYNFFTYDNGITTREYMRTREYIGSGVEQDSVIYIDSVIYSLTKTSNEYRQDNKSFKGVYTMYDISDNKLLSKTSYFEGFHEQVIYTYDSKGQLTKIENNLIGDDDKKLTTYTVIHYRGDGLVSETNFYDEKNELLERKIFSYK